MTMRVGSWPGPGFQGNDFIDIYCRALAKAGVKIVDVPDVVDIASGSIDILQIHWAEKIFWNKGGVDGLLDALALLRSIDRLKSEGVAISWMVHNLRPHESSWRRRLIWKLYSHLLARKADAVISLSPATLPLILRSFPFPSNIPKIAVRHPRYDRTTDGLDRKKAREKWNVPLDCTSIVFAGVVRPYKGVHKLACAIGELQSAGFHLTISGGVSPATYKAQIEEICSKYSNIEFFPGRTRPEVFEWLIASADYVALPFVDTLHSGSIVHALSLGRPVLTPRTPYALDLQEQIGSNWVQLYDPPISSEIFMHLPPVPLDQPDLQSLSPKLFGEKLAAFYHSLISEGSR